MTEPNLAMTSKDARRIDGARRKRVARRAGVIAALSVAGLIGAAAVVPQTPAVAQFNTENMSRAPLSFADIVERVKPAVVSIHVKGGVKPARDNSNRPGRRSMPDIPDLPEDHPLHDFFKRFGQPNQPNRGTPAPQPRLAQGSGFFVSADGYVVTNNHVIDDASKVEVSIDDKEKYEADVIGTDSRTDLALLKVKNVTKSFNYVRFAQKSPRVGDWVLAVGNPFGLGGTVTAGIVSAASRDIGNGPYDFMQIDAAVNRGNSGGPTFNLQGEVVGVNTAIYSPSGGNVGIAFAVPAQLAAQVVEELKAKGTVSRGWLGVNIQNVTDDIAKSLGMKDTFGAIVTVVTPGGPAQKFGLQVGDAIIGLDNDKVEDSRDLARKVAAMTPNRKVAVKVNREGAERIVTVDLGTFPTGDKLAKLEQGAAPTQPEVEQLGMTLAPMAPARPGAKADPGVLIKDVDNESEAASKGLRSGDVIVDVGGKTVNSVDDVLDGIKRAQSQGREAVLMRVKPGGTGNPRFIGLRFKKAG